MNVRQVEASGKSSASSLVGRRSIIDVHVARQPIVDRSGDLHGYELLFRPSADAVASGESGDAATSDVIVETFTEFGFERLVGETFAFVNVTRAFVTGQLPLPLLPERTVLELLETVEVDDAVVDGLRALRAQGYRLALDDYIGSPARDALIDAGMIDYVKVDITDLTPEDLEGIATVLGRPGLSLVAERVETIEQLELCASLGYVLFQGFVVGRPGVQNSSSLAPSVTACLELAAELNRPDIGPAEAAELVERDVGLSYRLLRLANSAAVSPARPISSIRDTVVLLGLDAVQAWVLLFGLVGSHAGPERQALGQALTRARQCQLVTEQVMVGPLADGHVVVGAADRTVAHDGRAESARPVTTSSAFLMGLVASLDRLLARTLPCVVAQLRLDCTLEDALLRHEGLLGAVLSDVLDYESGRMGPPGPPHEVMRHCYLTAATWADEAQVAVVAANGGDPMPSIGVAPRR